jgi:hypothetical protein
VVLVDVDGAIVLRAGLLQMIFAMPGGGSEES